MKKKSGSLGTVIILGLFCILTLIVLNYLFLVPISFKFISTTVFLLVLLEMILIILASAIEKRRGFFASISVIVFLIFIVYALASSTMFRAKGYRNLIGEVKEKTFSKEISAIDLNQIPVVDENLAKNLADKKLGEQVGLGSQVTLGDFTKCNVNEKLYWVAPLLHSGFFKWISNSEGTPGYMLVSATNPQDVKLVGEVNGKAIKIKYQPNAYFGKDLKRHVYMNGHKSIGLTDFSFELDDNMNPYWVITKYKNSIGFAGGKVTGIILVNAETGEMKDYAVNEVPEWIDRVYPQNFVENQLNHWGKLVHGWWNPSKKDMIQTTEGMNLIYNNGECYYYTGITSMGADEATIGFVLTNTKNKEATFYKVSGSNEIAAMQSAEGKVQNLGYNATFPILINIENVPTYFTTLKDKKGLVKLYAMVNVEDYSIVGTGESLKATKANYIKYLKSRNHVALQSSGDTIERQGTVDRIGLVIYDNTTYYHIVFKEMPNVIFSAAFELSNELPITKEGDKISFSYNESEGIVIDLMSFDNEELVQDKTQAQRELEQQVEN